MSIMFNSLHGVRKFLFINPQLSQRRIPAICTILFLLFLSPYIFQILCPNFVFVFSARSSLFFCFGFTIVISNFCSDKFYSPLYCFRTKQYTYTHRYNIYIYIYIYIYLTNSRPNHRRHIS